MTGKQLKIRRKAQGIETQKELAWITDMSLQTIKFWETDRNPIPSWLPKFLDMWKVINGKKRIRSQSIQLELFRTSHKTDEPE